MYKNLLNLIILPLLALSQREPPVICTENSVCYQGSWKNSTRTKFASFQGIRYAKPPIGELRFKPPQPYYAEEGVYDVSNVSTISCAQLNRNGLPTGQEDCLLINVYVPEIAFDNPQILLPVMFFIHGGSLRIGSNNFHLYGPQHFMERGVIIVTVNYRLGPLGFLSMGTSSVPGNGGLRDQSLALIWVRENIAQFGGDPGAVTIFGQSAGGFSVAMHLISPLSEGLFHRAILQSGTALEPGWGPITPEHALQYSDLFTKALGCDQDNDVLSCLQDKEMSDILGSTNLKDLHSIWYAVPDNEFTSEPFLTGNVDFLMMSGQFNTDVEVIVGTNADEGIATFFNVILDPTLWEGIRNNFDVYGPKWLFNIADESEITIEDVEKAHRIAEFYVGTIDNINEEHQQGMFDMFTDAAFLYGSYKTINHLVNNGVTVYQYILTYEGLFSWSQLHGIEPMGVCHCDDLYYLWDPVLDMELPLPKTDREVREVMTSAWVNFAINGDPTPPESGLSWIPMGKDSGFQYWNISGPLPIMALSKGIQERMTLWDKVLN